MWLDAHLPPLSSRRVWGMASAFALLALAPVLYLGVAGAKRKDRPRPGGLPLPAVSGLWAAAQLSLALAALLTLRFDYGYAFKRTLVVTMEIMLVFVTAALVHAMYRLKKIEVTRWITYIHAVLLALLFAAHLMHRKSVAVPLALLPYAAWHTYLLVAVHLRRTWGA